MTAASADSMQHIVPWVASDEANGLGPVWSMEHNSGKNSGEFGNKAINFTKHGLSLPIKPTISKCQIDFIQIQPIKG
jgi:hypothetical protein